MPTIAPKPITVEQISTMLNIIEANMANNITPKRGHTCTSLVSEKLYRFLMLYSRLQHVKNHQGSLLVESAVRPHRQCMSTNRNRSSKGRVFKKISLMLLLNAKFAYTSRPQYGVTQRNEMI